MDILTAISRLWPNGDSRDPGLLTGIAASAAAALKPYGITEPLVLAHIMAQISHECSAGVEMTENLNYSAPRLIEVWPSHFDKQTAAQYAHNPQALANYIYNPPCHRDLGNRENSNDGWTYRGRGATQVTGRANYERLGNETALPLLDNPDMVNDPAYFFKVGVADFVLCGCLPFARADDIRGVTRHLNGGLIGLAKREVWLTRWKSANLDMPTAA
jgi:putative chitinase